MNLKSAVILVTILFLTACNPPYGVDFTNGSQILRGTWTGATSFDSPPSSRLELVATYVNETTYNVTGTIQFGVDSPLSISGRVYSYNIKYIQAQTSQGPAIERFLADVKDSSGKIVQQLCVGIGTYDKAYSGFISGPNSFEISSSGLPDCGGVNSGNQLIYLRKGL